MFGFIKNLFKKKPKIYVVKVHTGYQTGVWQKIIAMDKPKIYWNHGEPFHNSPVQAVLGPLRSEVDAEELVDRLNLGQNQQFLLYDQSKVSQKK